MLAAQQLAELERAKLRRRALTIGSFMLVLIIVLTVVAFCVQPLTNIVTSGVGNIVATSDLFQFDLFLSASNFNIIPIQVSHSDLDVYVATGKHLHTFIECFAGIVLTDFAFFI
eukprot:jgi/Hompol1/3422/HPOL_003233-RA